LPQAEKENWNSVVGNYFQQLKKLGIQDVGLMNSGFDNFKNTILLILGFIPFLIGYIGNYLPPRIGKYFYDNKVKQLEFKAPVGLGVSIGIYLIYFLFFLILGFKMFGWSGIAIVLLVFFLGRFALIYREHYQMWKAARKVKQLSNDDLNELTLNRAKLINMVNYDYPNLIV